MERGKLIALLILLALAFQITVPLVAVSASDMLRTPNFFSKFYKCGILHGTATSVEVTPASQAIGGAFASQLNIRCPYMVISVQFADGSSVDFLTNKFKEGDIVAGEEYFFYIRRKWVYMEDDIYLDIINMPIPKLAKYPCIVVNWLVDIAKKNKYKLPWYGGAEYDKMRNGDTWVDIYGEIHE